MVKVIKAEDKRDFVTGDPSSFSIPVTLEGAAIDPATEVKVAVFSAQNRSGSEPVLIIGETVATYNNAEAKWTVSFTKDQTKQFLTDPANPFSELRGPFAMMVIQVGDLGTVFAKGLTVARGFID